MRTLGHILPRGSRITKEPHDEALLNKSLGRKRIQSIQTRARWTTPKHLFQCLHDAGLHATCVPDEAQDQADSVITGECENIWNAPLTEERDHALKLFRAIEPSGLNWVGETTIKIAHDSELLEAAAKSGRKYLLIGIETVDKEALKRAGKSFVKPEDLQDQIARSMPMASSLTALTWSTNGSFSLGVWRRGRGVKLVTSGSRPH